MKAIPKSSHFSPLNQKTALGGKTETFMKNLLYVFLISMLPLIELRGAVPVGAALGLPFYLYTPAAVIGNLLPVPFILLFIPKILDWLGRFKLFAPVVAWVRKKADKNSAKIMNGTFWGLLLFVLLPLPGTGAWTGSLVAALFDLPKRRSMLAITLGVLGCCVIMTLASEGVVSFLKFLL